MTVSAKHAHQDRANLYILGLSPGGSHLPLLHGELQNLRLQRRTDTAIDTIRAHQHIVCVLGSLTLLVFELC